MGVLAGVLLGLVALVTLVGFHTGPHTHLAAGVLGAVAAAAVAALALESSSPGGLWVLFAADVTLSAGVGVLAWRALTTTHRAPREHRLLARSGAEGVALTDMDPGGLVRVHGEEWTAVAVNAPVPRGTTVQVVGRGGVRLQVWGEEVPLGFGRTTPGEE
ncbi:MAG: NfeD family protein [Acidimicrobiaceae bacterium]|nr:NfeD family protein [Acidimicrobiaceae bacterium]